MTMPVTQGTFRTPSAASRQKQGRLRPPEVLRAEAEIEIAALEGNPYAAGLDRLDVPIVERDVGHAVMPRHGDADAAPVAGIGADLVAQVGLLRAVHPEEVVALAIGRIRLGKP